MMVIPELPEGIKRKFFEKIHHDKFADMAYTQELFKNIIEVPSRLLEGMSIIEDLYLPEEEDRQQYKFQIFKVCINLDEWKDQEIQGIQFTPKNLLEMGFVHRLVISQPRAVKIFYQDYWRLHYLLQNYLSKFDTSYLILEFHSTPPSFIIGYPDEARHEVLIRVINSPFSKPKYTSSDIDGFIDVCPMKNLSSYRSFCMAVEKERTYFEEYGLVSEERKMKIFKNHNLRKIFMPWLSHINEELKKKSFYEEAFASALIRTSPLMIQPEEDPIGFDDPDDIMEHNIQNMME